MNLYQANKSQLHTLKEKPFKLEREIQNLFEQNLSLLTVLEFVKVNLVLKVNALILLRMIINLMLL